MEDNAVNLLLMFKVNILNILIDQLFYGYRIYGQNLMVMSQMIWTSVVVTHINLMEPWSTILTSCIHPSFHMGVWLLQ